MLLGKLLFYILEVFRVQFRHVVVWWNIQCTNTTAACSEDPIAKRDGIE